VILLLAAALAADPTESRRHDGADVEPGPAPVASGFSFLGWLQVRGAATDVVTTNALLDGQIVGTLGGTNETTTQERPLALYSEQRLSAFLSYRPPVADGRLGLTAGFEIDFGFGDSSYATGGNRGGGFGADQVNLQTRRLHLDARAIQRPRHTLDLRLGLQMVTDGVRDPNTARREDLFGTGGGLALWGSEATGLTAYGVVRDASGVRLRYKAGAYTLWEFASGQVDDVTLYQADVELLPSWATYLGAHAWYLNDSSGGTQGPLGIGPTSALSELQGGPKLTYSDGAGNEAEEVNADVVWVGVDGGYNHDLGKGRFGVTGAVFSNLGRMTVPGVGWVGVQGVMAKAGFRARIAPGRGSLLRLDGLFVSGDNPATKPYDGLLTGNAWGVVGALHGGHGAVLLFPDVNAINRQAAVVYDVSNQGRGLLSGVVGLGYDVVPNRVNVSTTFAAASDVRRELMGVEINGRLEAEPLPFLTVGVTAAGVLASPLPQSPWTVLADLSWVVF
jgi:hypothetical protein